MKVVIVGGGTKPQLFSPPKGAEIWGLNAMRFAWVPYWTRMFNLHMLAHLKRDWPRGLKAEREWASINPEIPFYVCDPWPKKWAPRQVLFPRKALRKLPRGDYHAGSFDWLVPFAVHLGARSIALHGVRLNMESGEPISARACLEYWCGWAEGKGVKVTAAPDCDLFYQYHLVKSDTVYGYDDVTLVEDRVNGKADNSRGAGSGA